MTILSCITRRRPVFFEYTLIEGVNDSLEDARELVARVRGLPCKVNLIPMNAHADSPHGAPAEPVMERFMAELARAGLVVTLRKNRGADEHEPVLRLERQHREQPIELFPLSVDVPDGVDQAPP